MLRTSCPARLHFRTHGLRHALASLAVVAGGGLLPLVGAAASQIEATPAPVVQAYDAVIPSAGKASTFTPGEVRPTLVPTTPAPVAASGRPVGVGQASFYGKGDGFAGRKTANGEIFDPSKLTAAHRTLPIGTRLKVTNLANRRTVVVRINDRGPYAKGRILDLSYGAAKHLGMISSGHAQVRLERLG